MGYCLVLSVACCCCFICAYRLLFVACGLKLFVCLFVAEFAVCCFLFVCCALRCVHCLLFFGGVGCGLLFAVVRCLVFGLGWLSLLVACCLVIVVCCFFAVVCCLLFFCLMLAGRYLVFVVGCLLVSVFGVASCSLFVVSVLFGV